MTGPDPETSNQVRRALHGDRDSLEWVVTRFTPLLKAQAAWRLGPALEGQYPPEDIVAEAWLVALRRLPDLIPGPGRFTPRMLAFLGTCVLNIANRRIKESLRRGAREEPPHSPTDGAADVFAELADTVTGAITNAARNETAAALEAALASLDPRDREVILLRLVEGLSNQDAADDLHEAPNTVAQRYRRALARLREALPASFVADLVPD